MTARLLAAIPLLVLALLAQPASGRAETYPNRPVRLIVPFPPSGGVDIISRVVSDILSQSFGQSFVVENRPGAGANLGAELLARSPPDGYTIGTMTIGTHGINPALYAHLPFDPVADFTPITLLVVQPNAMVVPASLGVRTVAEFIALARAKPGKLNFASSGNGTSLHMCGELFKQMTGVDIVHIPYRGAGPALTDLLSGQVHAMFGNLPSISPHIRTGALVALAVTTRERWPPWPDVPTLDEAGVTGFDVSSWYALMGPAKMPRERVMALNQALVRGMENKVMRDRLIEIGTLPATGTPEQLAAYIDGEIKRWAPIVKATGLTVD